MAKKAPKARVISVRLISMAMTGFFYQFTRPRTARPMSMLKYDPVGMLPTPPSPPFLRDSIHSAPTRPGSFLVYSTTQKQSRDSETSLRLLFSQRSLI
ncbi:hypothetical protein GGR50DRAFT_694829 [Xylaria sp. CBS 124048]|nr:hypothetical protein GGR50DRAFT_694829 [Xylaria sp. CBS 124048]